MAIKSAFVKPPERTKPLIALLKARGLTFTPAEETEAYRLFRFIGYFRLAGYAIPFQLPRTNGSVPHQFAGGITFSHISALHEFDCALRHLAGAPLQRVEVALRAVVCDKLSLKHNTGQWFLAPSVFLPASEKEIFGRIGHTLGFDFVANRPMSNRRVGVYPFLDDFYNKHTGPPPGWMLREVGSFGLWSLMFDNLSDNADRQSIANEFKFPDGKAMDQKLLRGWMHSLSVFRNVCAHHHRVAHTIPKFTPAAPAKQPWAAFFPTTTTSVASVLRALAFLEQAVNPSSQWLASLKALCGSWDQRVDISAALGFTPNWQTDALWTL